MMAGTEVSRNSLLILSIKHNKFGGLCAVTTPGSSASLDQVCVLDMQSRLPDQAKHES
jgi:hypothetical protein